MKIPAIAGCLLAFASLALGQSLGEVAARTKEQRKGQAPAKPFTDDDLARAASERERNGVPSAEAAGDTGVERYRGSTSTTGAAPSDMAALDQKIRSWQTRYAAAKTRIERLEEEVASLASALSEERRYGVGAHPKTTDALAKAREQLEQARAELDPIVERARLDGVSFAQLTMPDASPETRTAQPSEAAAPEASAPDRNVQRWRERYLKVEARIKAVEKELEEAKDREARVSHVGAQPSRVPPLERQLATLKDHLGDIVDGARRDGVSLGQLY